MSENAQNGGLNVALFGPPGSGKGTQAELLIQEFGFAHLSPGDLLRKEIKEKSPLGQQAEAVMAAGQLMPDDVIHGIVGNNIGSVVERRGRVLLDGFPRTLVQFDFLQNFLKEHETRMHGVFFLDIDSEKLIARLTGRRICQACGAVFHVASFPPKVEGVCDKCGGPLVQRKDDNRESIQERLTAYENQTMPILKAYEAQGKLIRIDGDRDRETIYGEIAATVRSLIQETSLACPA